MKTSQQSSGQMPRRMGRRLLLLAAFLLALYVVAPQIKGLSLSRQTIGDADWSGVLLGLLLTCLTYTAAAFLYKILALKPIDYLKTLLVQVSSGFVNRLLPAGIGGIGLNVAYLHRQKHSYSQAAVVVAANSLLGIIGHFVLLAGVMLFGDISLRDVDVPHLPVIGIVAGAVVVVALLVAVSVSRLRDGLHRSIQSLARSLAIYRHKPQKLLAGLAISLFITVLYGGILWACAEALGIDLSLTRIFIVFSVGALIGTATPTPGGVVGAEAGLVAGFIAYDVPGDVALATALLYRLLTYWLPLLPGFLAYLVVQRRPQPMR